MARSFISITGSNAQPKLERVILPWHMSSLNKIACTASDTHTPVLLLAYYDRHILRPHCTVLPLCVMGWRSSLSCVLCRRLRILAAGGDGTVAWILTTIRELQLQPPPAVAVMPLGTGNDLSLSFGWGNTFLHKWIAVCIRPYMLMLSCKLPCCHMSKLSF